MMKSAWGLGSKMVDKGIRLAAKKVPTIGKALGVGLGNRQRGAILGKGQGILRGTAKMAPGVAAYSGASALLGDSGPADTFMGNDFSERAMNQLKYNLDMTNDELEAHLEAGNSIQETGLIGEGGLSEQEALKYIKENSDHREGWHKARDRIVDVAGLFNPFTAGAAIYNDSRLGKERVQNLNNVVGKLRADANEGEIRRNMEGTMGKFMSEGILDKDFGRGKVRTSGGIKPAEDRAAKAEEAAALKEYESIKAKDGIFAALQSPAAMKAGRQVYLDVQEASGGDKNTAEALLSGVGGQEGVGLTDQETMERYYGNPEKNALSNEANAAKAALASAQEQAKREQASSAATQAQQVRQEATSGPMNINPAQNPEQLRLNREMINASKGWHGESLEGEKQRAYFEDRGMSTARGMGQRLEAAADLAYEQKHGFGRYSPQAYNLSLENHAKAMAKSQEEYRKRRAMLADQEYAKHIVKPGDPDYKLGPQVTASTPDEMAQADRGSAASMGDGSVPSPQAPLPAQVNQSANTPGIPSNIAPPRPNPGLVPPTVPPASVMKPTPYGVGTATPGFPKLPDIGGPARNAGERIGNLIFGANAPGNPAPGMKPTPYGLGSGTAGMPQVPDIGAPVRNAVEGALTTQSSAPGQMPKGPMNQADIAKLIAEQKRKEIEARNAQMPRNPGKTRPNPMKPLY